MLETKLCCGIVRIGDVASDDLTITSGAGSDKEQLALPAWASAAEYLSSRLRVRRQKLSGNSKLLVTLWAGLTGNQSLTQPCSHECGGADGDRSAEARRLRSRKDVGTHADFEAPCLARLVSLLRFGSTLARGTIMYDLCNGLLQCSIGNDISNQTE